MRWLDDGVVWKSYLRSHSSNCLLFLNNCIFSLNVITSGTGSTIFKNIIFLSLYKISWSTHDSSIEIGLQQSHANRQPPIIAVPIEQSDLVAVGSNGYPSFQDFRNNDPLEPCNILYSTTNVPLLTSHTTREHLIANGSHHDHKNIFFSRSQTLFRLSKNVMFLVQTTRKVSNLIIKTVLLSWRQFTRKAKTSISR